MSGFYVWRCLRCPDVHHQNDNPCPEGHPTAKTWVSSAVGHLQLIINDGRVEPSFKTNIFKPVDVEHIKTHSLIDFWHDLLGDAPVEGFELDLARREDEYLDILISDMKTFKAEALREE